MPVRAAGQSWDCAEQGTTEELGAEAVAVLGESMRPGCTGQAHAEQWCWCFPSSTACPGKTSVVLRSGCIPRGCTPELRLLQGTRDHSAPLVGPGPSPSQQPSNPQWQKPPLLPRPAALVAAIRWGEGPRFRLFLCISQAAF
ncbi:sodium/calcium exchanger 2 [Platysternon megacephalum]|uniref:Sodium/calcium exchanger 2 n=1 Tax=Platysternon megacephalum TaxID=55544 RepID=A0A4D9DVU3_9SAUR|nr:sodium/calcium exchanger 2 [Platysternon megacephalum]